MSGKDDRKAAKVAGAENRAALAPLRARLRGIEVTLAKLNEEAKVIKNALADPRL